MTKTFHRPLDCFVRGAQNFRVTIEDRFKNGVRIDFESESKEVKMDTLRSFVAFFCIVFGISPCVWPPSLAHALTQVLPEAVIEADQESFDELIGTFDRAQEAIRARDIEGLMALYSPNYQFHGMNRDDIRKIWEDLFARYDFIANIHTFSSVKVIKNGTDVTAEITCTGAVWANSKKTKQRIPIDSWHQEVHRLVRGEEGWRIVGNLGGDKAVRHFGTAPHPLF